MDTWCLIPLSKWVITPVISGLTLLIPFITGVITHLLSGMSHQVDMGNLCNICKFYIEDYDSEKIYVNFTLKIINK